jgi:hypothetical protein
VPYWASDSDTFGANTFGSIDGIDIDGDKKMLT